jgi:hypothetical protein
MTIGIWNFLGTQPRFNATTNYGDDSMHPKVKDYLDQVGKWQKELELLRLIMIGCELNEDFKWKHPYRAD